MSTPFQMLRDKLRDAGCRLVCAEQVKTANGAFIELWLCYPEGSGLVRLMVIDERESGYSLFIENATAMIDGDVQAILIAGLRGLPSLEKS